jgi:hypothetical protein
VRVGDEWAINVAGWIIQDGNYRDFVVGDQSEFAVEAYAEYLSRTSGEKREPSAMRLEGRGAWYDVAARVIYVRESAWVLDIGILVYGNRADLPDGVEIGDMVSGRVHLEVSGPAVYPEAFRIPGEAVYRWQIEAIDRETTPWLQPDPERQYFHRDPDNVSFVSVPQTDAWNDEATHDPNYVLHCREIPQADGGLNARASFRNTGASDGRA